MSPDPKAEDREAAAMALSHDIAQYLARFDCHNVDPTVDPIDLLRQVAGLIETYDEELEQKDRLIEQLKAGHIDALKEHRLDQESLIALRDKVNQTPWIKIILDRLRTQ